MSVPDDNGDRLLVVGTLITVAMFVVGILGLAGAFILSGYSGG